MYTGRYGTAEPLEQLPASLRTFIARERFQLHKLDSFRAAIRDTAFDTRYLPERCDAFELPCFIVPLKNFYIYGRNNECSNSKFVFDDGFAPESEVLFPIHPAELPYYRNFLECTHARDAVAERPRVWAVPTSSTRTLLAWPDGQPGRAVFLKTPIHSPFCGDRRLYRRRVAGCVGLSTLVHNALPLLPKDLRYFFEPVGLVPRLLPDSGVIVREIPIALKTDQTDLAPLFSLMGGSAEHQPALLSFFQQSTLEICEFIEDVLCRQFARLWLEMTLGFGLLLEAHGQDLMITLSPDLSHVGLFVYRDFEGLAVDWELRRMRGMSSPHGMPNGCSWHETYATWGYRYYQLVCCKIRTSLIDYLHFVLHEVGEKVREWQDEGRLGGEKLRAGHVTACFSEHLRRTIGDRWGFREREEYDIYTSLNRFLIFLMKVRKEVIWSGSPD